jgi:hypothetical protein
VTGDGNLPVKKLARAGEQTGQGVNAFAIRAPDDARYAMFGATISEFP